jgi:hypothetical protein
MNAVRAGNVEAVDVLLAAGADVNRQTACGTALGDVQTREIALRLLNAGADPANLSFEGRRAILGMEAEPSALLFSAMPEDFRTAPTARFGGHNPELVNQPFWLAMIRSGISAYQGSQLVGGTGEDSPVWCAQRFGQSLTLLTDGRAIQIGGEHEDHYDPDFCIYNDVFVHQPDGHIEIFCYPEDIFRPTDFHTATLSGESIYIVGGLGYLGARRFGETPVYRLDINTLRVHPIETKGEPPGWISKHRAVLISAHEIRILGGKISSLVGGKEAYEDSSQAWIFDITSSHWRRE